MEQPVIDAVVAGLDPAIHVLQRYGKEDVDTRDIGAKQSFVASPGHDGGVGEPRRRIASR